MEPSSLVFVAIVALWLVALVPGWLRRRQHLALAVQTRSSAAARVLEPRVHRRSRAASASLLTSPITLTSPIARSSPIAPAVVASVAEPPAAQAVTGPGEAAEAAAAHASPSGPPPVERSTGRPSPAPAPRSPAARVAARRRAAVLLVLVVATGGTWAVVAAASLGLAPPFVSGLTWAAAVPVSSLLLLDLVALRASARRRSRGRNRSEGERQRPVAASRPQVRQNPMRQPVTESADLDLDALTATDGEGAIVEVDTSWTPVPVPPPTYTLKPVVVRGAPSPMDLAHRLDLAEGAESSGARVIFSSGPARTSASNRVDDVRALMDDVAGSATASAGEREEPAPVRQEPEEPVVTIDLDEVLARRRAVNG